MLIPSINKGLYDTLWPDVSITIFKDPLFSDSLF